MRFLPETINDSLPRYISSNGWNSNVRMNSQFKEQIIATIATEFAKQEFRAISMSGNENKQIDYLLSVSTNEQQTAFDFKSTMITQLYNYGNAIARPFYNFNGEIESINIVDLGNYEFGYGYVRQGEEIFLVLKQIEKNIYEYLPLVDIIHIRLNPHNIFYGDKPDNNSILTYQKLIDSVLENYSNNIGIGRVTGTLKLGKDLNFGGQLSEEEKQKKYNELITRIENSFETGILVLDKTEEFNPFQKTWNKVDKEELDKILSMMYARYGINESIINGTATIEESQQFVSKVIKPLLLQFQQEYQVKLIGRSDYEQGHRIVYSINPLDYIPLSQVGDTIYKVSHIYTINEIREFTGAKPISGGDVRMDNLNFTKGGDNNEENNNDV